MPVQVEWRVDDNIYLHNDNKLNNDNNKRNKKYTYVMINLKENEIMIVRYIRFCH